MTMLGDIEKLLMAIDFDIEVEREPKFASHAADKIVFFGDRLSEIEKDNFMAAYIDIGLFFDCSIETFAVLHEVGHIMTLSHLSSIEQFIMFNSYIESAKEIKKLNDPRKEFRAYIDLPVEKMANDWAVDFMDKHPEFVERLDKVIEKYYEDEVF